MDEINLTDGPPDWNQRCAKLFKRTVLFGVLWLFCGLSVPLCWMFIALTMDLAADPQQGMFVVYWTLIAGIAGSVMFIVFLVSAFQYSSARSNAEAADAGR